MAEHDITGRLQQSVREALREPPPGGLHIRGGNTRSGLLATRRGAGAATTLDTGGHSGVILYQPDELVLRARAGTSLAELDGLLADHAQQFAAEIPRPATGSTLGGAVACGWDGPARPYGMSLRDTVLGCSMVNGRGDLVSFGGQVMKNVAGYDLARMQVGALGTLGVLLDVSLRLAPRPEYSATRVLELPAADLPGWWQMAGLLRPLLRGTCYMEGRLYLRLSGRRAAVEKVLPTIGGEDGAFDWESLGNLRLPFFCAERLACVYLPPHTDFHADAGGALVEWEGARVWVRDGDHGALQRQARELGGFVRVLRGPAVEPGVNTGDWQRRIREAFDPAGLFNRATYETHFRCPERPPCR
ncbi:FAD-binding protein [Microbulbifer yueqingensis]|uniref:Glycolate oxidase FAD binding subunit n=1 Tax=Microbulbifer yueqingensis TaxID=658219 RepID=A0A1G9AMF9_9GAMM|nr:FAD-binding protein [Microbulbifer yueqingensis]SDK28477.1 glycolate oxidase FAD binding subunit [Microbulbifer yueqingensis]